MSRSTANGRPLVATCALGALAACAEPPPQVVTHGPLSVTLAAEPGEDPFAEITEIGVTVEPDQGEPKTATAPASARQIAVPTVRFEQSLTITVEGRDQGAVLSRGARGQVLPGKDSQDLTVVLKRIPGSRRTASPPLKARSYGAAATLAGGRVFLFGGHAPAGGVPETELFDPATRRFEAGPLIGDGRWDFGWTVSPGGKILVAGGQSAASTAERTVLDVSPSGPPSTAVLMAVGRVGCSVTFLPQTGNLLVAGGVDSANVRRQDAELFVPSGTIFQKHPVSPTLSLALPRAFHSAVALPDGSVLLVGGDEPTAEVTPELIFPQKSPPTSVTVDRTLAPRRQPVIVDLLDGLVVAGASPSTTEALGRIVEKYDAGTRAFKGYTTLLAARIDPAVAKLGGGRGLFFAGGKGASGGVFSDAEVAVAGGTGFRPGNLFTSRVGATASLLPDGSVLVAGGRDEPSAEIFLP